MIINQLGYNLRVVPFFYAILKAKLAEKEQEAIEQDRKDFELGYLEALEQAKTGKDADGKNTDDEAVEKIAENLGYMSGFVAKLAELGEAGDKNKSNRLIQDFVDNLKDDVLYDKTVWENASKDLAGLKNNINNFVLPAANQAVATTEAFKKAQEKGFAEGKTDGFTSYQIYAVGNSKLKTDVKMEKEEGSDPFVTNYFKTHAKDFEAILKNVSDNNLVNYWRTKFSMFKDAKTSQELAGNSAFQMQVNKEFFKDKLTPAQEKTTPDADPKKAKAQPFLEFDMEKSVYRGEATKFVLDYQDMPATTVRFEKAGSEFKTLSIGADAQRNSKDGAIQIKSAQDGLYLMGAGIELSKNPPQNTSLFKSALKIPKADTNFYPNFKKLGIDEKKVEEALIMGDSSGRLSLTDKDYKKSLREVQNKLIKLANVGGVGTKVENIGTGTQTPTTETKIEGGNIQTPTPPNQDTIVGSGDL